MSMPRVSDSCCAPSLQKLRMRFDALLPRNADHYVLEDHNQCPLRLR